MTPQTAIPLRWLPQQLLAGLTSTLPVEEPLIEHLAVDAADCGPGTLFPAAQDSAEGRLHAAARAAASGCRTIAIDPDVQAVDTAALESLAKDLGLQVLPINRLNLRAGEIAARFFGDPSTGVDVIGVFGRRRADSISHLIAQALVDQRCGLISEFGHGFIGELHDDGQRVKTDPVQVQQQLARLHTAGARTAVTACAPDGLRIHNAVLASDPAPGRSGRAELAAMRRVVAQPGLRWAVVNRDAPLSARLESALGRGVARACFSLQPGVKLEDCDCWARPTRIEPTPQGLALELETSAGHDAVEVPLLGRFNVPNLLAVIGVLLSSGRNLRSALGVIARLRGVPGRLEPFTAARSPLVVVDNASTPRMILRTMRQLRGHRRGNLITVFGCAGGEDSGKRSRMGAIAERLSDRVILTDDNPREEDGDEIISAILAGVGAPNSIVVERQRAVAIRRAIALAGSDDTVLIAGKGHETTQEMGELKVHFSDRAQVVQTLSERRGSDL